MLKKGFWFIIALLVGLSAVRANNLDLKTRELLNYIKATQLPPVNGIHSQNVFPSLLKFFPVCPSATNGLVVKAFIKIDPAIFNQTSLTRNQIKINSNFGDILTVQIPLNSLTTLTTIDGVQWVELARTTKYHLDHSRREIAAEQVQQWVSEVGRAFSGRGVILGIVDSGIDFTHPDFQNADGTTRIISIWDQKSTKIAPPAGFSSGYEWTANQINTRQCSHQDFEAHGTHVLGIAAGNGSNLFDAPYRGIAPETDLMVVATSGISTDILDGINYFMKKANNLNRPIVVNLSLGSHEGPHDGTSLFDQGLEQLVGPGKIIVGSAGNEGNQFVHIQRRMANDSVFTCFATPDDGLAEYNFIDLWGKVGANLNVALLATDRSGKIHFYKASSKKEVMQKYFIAGRDTVAKFIWIGYEINRENNAPHYRFTFYLNPQNSDYYWYIRVAGTGEFDAWTENNPSGVHFKPTAPSPFPYARYLYLGGDNNKSISEIGGTAKSIITVGAYTTKNKWTNYQHFTYQMEPLTADGQIAPFSSIGPTRDGRLKPEVCAPGFVITSALSASANPSVIAKERIMYLPQAPAFSQGYINFEGTSMAAPHVAGTVALMLEANPTLTPAEAKLLLQRNAREDQFTAATPNDRWGFGKIDSYYSVKNAARFTAVASENVFHEATAFQLLGNFPNPFNGETTFRFKLNKDGFVTIKLFDCLGREISTLFTHDLTMGVHEIKFNGKDLTSGIYFYQCLFNDHFSTIRKLVLIK